MGEHALLSASGAHRWLKCTKSPRLEEMIEEKSSEYAKEGSFAHMLAELELKLFLEHINKRQFNKIKNEMMKSSYY